MSNSTKLCSKCQTEIPKKAIKCPNCRSDLRGWFGRHPLLSFILITFLIGSGMSSYYGTGTYSSNSSSKKNQIVEDGYFEKNPMELCIYSQQWVEDEIKPILKNPKSLELPTCSDEMDTDDQYVIQAPDGGYMYQSHYYSQNSFGAKVKNDFACAIRYGIYPKYTYNCAVIE